MVEVTIDTSEVDRFVAHLSGAGGRLAGVVTPVIKRAAQNIKTDLQADFGGSSNRGIRGIRNKVRYDDVNGNQHGWQTTIGIDKGGSGSLGNIAVFGTPKGGGTHMHPSFYAAQEMPAFEAHLVKAVEGII